MVEIFVVSENLESAKKKASDLCHVASIQEITIY
jgi:hypothetical protein